MNSVTLNEVTLARAIEAYKSGQPDEAQRLFLEVLELAPENPDALYFMSMIDHQAGRAEVAEHRAGELARIKPEDGKALNLLGTIEMSLGKLDEASETFKKGMRWNPEHAMLRVNAAICEVGRGEPGKAVDYCREAASLQPGYANAYNIMGTAQLGMSDNAAAADSFRQSLEISPDSLDARFNLGMALLNQHDYGEACVCFEAVLEAAPRHLHALTRKADIDTIHGHLQEAENGYRAALEQQATFTPALVGYGKLLLQANRPEDALGLFKKALEQDPDSIEALMHAGDAFRKLQQPDAAEAAFRDVLSIDPDNFQARFHLAAIAGEDAPAKPDGEYVQRLFDEFADNFDESLSKVGYDAPQQLSALAESLVPAGKAGTLDILDLGCGTGLAGVEFKKYSAHIKGVDISPRMIERARQRGIYDELEERELLDALVRHQKDTDIAICADTFPYIGDLESPFLAVSSALRPGGLFLFSVETHDDDDDYLLNSTARYSHSENYIRTLSARRGFEILACNRSAYRKEAGAPIDSLIVAVRKTDRPSAEKPADR